MPRTLTLTLAEREFQIPQASLKQARAWRAQVRTALDEVMTLAPNLTVDLSTIGDLVTLADTLVPILVTAPDTLFRLVLAYTPILEAQRDLFEEHAYDDEVAAALMVMVKAAFPLDALTAFLGPANPQISKNSPAPSGDLTSPSLTTTN